MRTSLLLCVILTAAAGLCAGSPADDRKVRDDEQAMSNLRQIYQAILIHVADNKGEYPPDLNTARGELKPELFIRPGGPTRIPPESENDAELLGAWVSYRSDVVYAVPPGTKITQLKPLSVVLLMRPMRQDDTLIVCFADGRVMKYEPIPNDAAPPGPSK